MAQKELEEQIGRALCSRAESIQVTSADTERMRRSVHRKIEEESGMKKWNMKRVFVVAAAICVLGTITAVAAGKVAYTSAGGSHLDDFTYDKLGEMETKLGYTTNAPEVFSNGYRFDMGMPTHQDAMDEDGNVIKSAESFSLHYKKIGHLTRKQVFQMFVSLHYKKDGSPDIFVTVQGTSLFEEEGQPDQVFEHNGITLNYTRDQYRFVPPDYQASEEEKAKEAAGELYISYGSDTVTDQVAQSMLWKDGEKVYIITAMDNPMTAQDMAQMAGELIDNKQ